MNNNQNNNVRRNLNGPLSGAYGIGIPSPNYNAINNAASAAASAAAALLRPAAEENDPMDQQPQQQQPQQPTEEHEIEVENIIIENTEYYINEDGEVFDCDLQELVGIYNRQSRQWVQRFRPPTGPVANYGRGSPFQ